MADRLTPEMIDAALTYADSWDEGPPEQLHTVVLAAALREAQDENKRLQAILTNVCATLATVTEYGGPPPGLQAATQAALAAPPPAEEEQA